MNGPTPLKGSRRLILVYRFSRNLMLTNLQNSYKIMARRSEFLTVQLIAQAAYPFLFLCLPNHTGTVFHPGHDESVKRPGIH